MIEFKTHRAKGKNLFWLCSDYTTINRKERKKEKEKKKKHFKYHPFFPKANLFCNDMEEKLEIM